MKIIDTHTTVKELIAAGFPEKQAEVLVDTFVARGIDKGSFVLTMIAVVLILILSIGLIRSFWK